MPFLPNGTEAVGVSAWPVSRLRILLCPFLGCLDRLCLVLLPRLSHIVRQGIIWVRGTQEGLDGEEDGTNLQRGRPVALEHVETNTA